MPCTLHRIGTSGGTWGRFHAPPPSRLAESGGRSKLAGLRHHEGNRICSLLLQKPSASAFWEKPPAELLYMRTAFALSCLIAAADAFAPGAAPALATRSRAISKTVSPVMAFEVI